MRRAIVPRGFTLVELAVALLVVGILASIAYPSYLQYARRANRGDATRSIMFTAQQLERCYSQTYSYLGCPNITYGAGPSPNNYYTITTTALAAPNSYSITAVPNGPPQNNDGQCTSFTLQSNGAQTNAGTGTVQQCWGSS
jgi:type IV pilus assembly protein PilE